MSSITIRNLDPVIKERLRVRAAEHGHSMEAEARRILQTALTGAARPPGRNLYERVRARFAPLGGVDLGMRHNQFSRRTADASVCCPDAPRQAHPAPLAYPDNGSDIPIRERAKNKSFKIPASSAPSPKSIGFRRRSVGCFSRRERSAAICVITAERATRKNSQLAPARKFGAI